MFHSRAPLLVVGLLSALLSACAPSLYPEPIVRRPVPSLYDPVVEPTKVPKGMAVVRRGDSLYKLARRYGVPLRRLIEVNRLRPPYVIVPGQQLRLPQARHHVTNQGETIYAIARRYNVDAGSLVRINNIPPPYRIKNGQRLRLPETRGKPTAIASSGTRRDTRRDKRRGASRKTPRRVAGPTRLPPPETRPSQRQRVTVNRPDPRPLKQPPPRSKRKFLWPVRGKVIVSFGANRSGKHNDGINIAARRGTAIRATENGVVVYAGNQLQGFGNLILVKHAGGWMSAYAHSSAVLVKRGDVVRRGQVIARVGKTGNVSRPQLHFELRKGDQAVNPKRHLVRLAYLAPHPGIWKHQIPS